MLQSAELMPDDANLPDTLYPLPQVVRSDADYQRVMRRIRVISQDVGREPEERELSDLLARAERWEELIKR